MKRVFSLILAFIIMISLCACEGNWETVSLKDPISIPADGIIQKNILEQIKSENAIGIFTGTSGNLKYEWTIFGSDITDVKNINLQVQLTEAADGSVAIRLSQNESFGFSALLSVYLNNLWGAQSATAYTGEKAVASVSVTGSKTTILNLSLDGTNNDLVIRPDAPEEEAVIVTEPETVEQDSYLSKPAQQDGKVYKDKYNTDPVPAGKPQPVEPEDAIVDQNKTYTCTFSIECSTILNNLDQLDPEKLEMVPSGGVILKKTTVTFYEGESVFDVLQRVCKEQGIHLESSWTPIYNSAYIEGIHNLYEFDCGELSGWMYRVNGWYPNYGSSRYQLQDGDVVEWRFTCDLGNDIGGGYAVGG